MIEKHPSEVFKKEVREQERITREIKC
jgi:hypothetical protein